MEEPQALYQLVMYSNCIFEIYLLYHFLEGTFTIYEERKWVKVLETVGCAAVIFIVNSFRLPGINFICVPIINLLFAWLIFRMTFKYNVLYVFLFYLVMSITEFIFHYIYKILGIDPSIMEIRRILLLIIQAILRFIIVQILNKQHQSRTIRNSDSYRYLKFLFVLPIATFILLNGFVASDKFSLKYFFICLGGVLMIAANIIEFFIVEKLLIAEQVAMERGMFAQKTKLEQAYYTRLEEINQSNAEYIHEMNHFIRTIKELSCTDNNDILQSLVSEVSQKSKPLTKKYYLDDKIANAIFLEREKKAADLFIKYLVDIQPGINLSFMEDTDKISMFGNLLDNALEATTGNIEGFVHVCLFTGNPSFVVFKVENNFKLKPQKQGNRYITLKRNEEQHGFGIKKVEELAEKYKGKLNIIESESTFTVTLLLSNVQILDN